MERSLRSVLGRPARRLAARLGFEVTRRRPDASGRYPYDFDDELVALCERVASYTLTSPERIVALRDAVRYVVRAGVPGAFVECGVWRGGSAMVMTDTLNRLDVTDRDVHLFDTFTHMPYPGEHDVDIWGRAAADFYDDAVAEAGYRYLPLDEVRAAVVGTGYPAARIHFVPGMIEDTVPDQAPDRVALCRLDTDWYESTAHELEYLWPRLEPGGVLLVDDYGQFQGAKKAVDEYFAAHGIEVLLHRIDFTGRLVVKPGR